WEALAAHADELGLSFDDDGGDSPDAAFAQVRAVLGEVGLGAARIRAIVESLRGFARRDAAELSAVDLRAAIAEAAKTLAARLAAGSSLTVDGEAPPVRASAPELERLFTHLIANALDAMGGRGEVAVRLRADGDQAEATVEDRGPGIPEEALPRLFDPFFTT